VKKRKIIEIDRAECNGCGQCVEACAEGAIALVDGKAQLVSDVYCDGLGACIGECPTGALTVVEREAAEFDEDRAKEHVHATRASSHEGSGSAAEHTSAPLACGCPGSHEMTLERTTPGDAKGICASEIQSELTHWPIKLRLLNPRASFLEGRDLVLVADCAAAAFPNLHTRFLSGNSVALACPKFDDPEDHIERLSDIIREAGVRSLTVVHMEVPCCHGLMTIAREAAGLGGRDIALRSIVISRSGEILQDHTEPGTGRGEVGCVGR
jgi:NAD-dependent dihydropyrimidine dehydrogenase PreA subunit